MAETVRGWRACWPAAGGGGCAADHGDLESQGRGRTWPQTTRKCRAGIRTNDLFDVMRKYLLPRFDQTFSALLDDLDQRGLLASTLVLFLGEFGRAPRVALEPKFSGATPGPEALGQCLFDDRGRAGVERVPCWARRQVRGLSYIDRYGPWDVHATIAAALGLDPEMEYHDRLARPFRLTIGRPITGLYGSATRGLIGQVRYEFPKMAETLPTSRSGEVVEGVVNVAEEPGRTGVSRCDIFHERFDGRESEGDLDREDQVRNCRRRRKCRRSVRRLHGQRRRPGHDCGPSLRNRTRRRGTGPGNDIEPSGMAVRQFDDIMSGESFDAPWRIKQSKSRWTEAHRLR